MKPEISIIIPVYNGEKHLRECLDSVLNQSYRDFELILINDGSTDSSLSIIGEYADSRIRVMNQPNSGTSKTRFNGIAEARGEFIAFIDDDDIVKPDYLEKLYSKATDDVDIVCCNAVDEEHPEGNKVHILTPTQIISDKAVLYGGYLDDKRFSITIWAKLIRRSLFEGTSGFPVTYGEDEYMNLYLFGRCNKVALMPYYGYEWRLQPSSSLHSANRLSFTRDLIRCREYALDCISKECPALKGRAKKRLNDGLFAIIFLLSGKYERADRDAYRAEFERVYLKLKNVGGCFSVKGFFVKQYFEKQEQTAALLKTLYLK